MKMRILSTLVFSTLLFAGMYSEARPNPNPNNKGVSGKRGVAPVGNQSGEGATAGRRNSVQQRIDAVRGDSNGRSGLTRRSGRVFPGQGTSVRENGDLLRDMGLARQRGPFIEAIRDTGVLREGEVVRDVGVMRTNVNAGTNQSHRLSEAFTSILSAETAQALARVVNGTNAHLKASVLKLNEQVKKGTHQFRESIQWAGRLIAFVSGVSTVKNPVNQDPVARELLHDMANNAGEAVAWPREPRNNFFAIVQSVLKNRNTHPQGLAGAFKDAVRQTFQLARDKVMEKFWEIRRECRA